MVTQNGLNSLLVTWTPSAGPNVTGYTIFYQQQDGEHNPKHSMEAGETDSSVTITGLMRGATYNISIVANSNTLPSDVVAKPNQTIGIYTLSFFVAYAPSFIFTLFAHLKSISTVFISHNLSTAPATIFLPPSSMVMVLATVTLTCSLSLPSGVTDTPVFQWERNGVPLTATSTGVSSDLTLSKISSEAGVYSCTASLRGSISDTTNITVQGEWSCSLY